MVLIYTGYVYEGEASDALGWRKIDCHSTPFQSFSLFYDMGISPW
jgi:hypothetical protein